MNLFQVSVIIPVYNAASFVVQAVESALAQPETAEVVLIEDGSLDDSLAVCQTLAEKYAKVFLLRHPNDQNRGAGASRNLGMRNAKYDYIAFLDADDFYLPGRFEVAKEIFETDPECDGVYEAIGKHYENKHAKKHWQDSGMSRAALTTMKKDIDPDDLFDRLMQGSYGYFSLDGLVFKHSILKRTGLMNGKLKMHEDTDFMFKLAYVGKLRPGSLDEPVAMRRIHGNNRVSASRTNRRIYQDRMKMWIASYRWFKRRAGKQQKNLILNRLLSFGMNVKHYNTETNIFSRSQINRRLRLFLLIFEAPELVFEEKYWEKFLPLRLQKRIHA